MKKITLLVAVTMLLVAAVPALAKNPKSPADHNGLNKGKSDMQRLYLYEKNQETWDPIKDGAWGKMTFDQDRFVFNGHRLELEEEYTLIRYIDPWPGYPLVCLGSGIADEEGNVHIAGEMMNGGPKVWLVLSEDVDCKTMEMTGWTPEEYLFEYDLIEGWEYVETVTVNATTSDITSSLIELENEVEYVIGVSGTYEYWPSCPAGTLGDDSWPPCIADAAYSLRPASSYGPGWVSLDSTPYKGYLELKIDGENIDWGDYNSGHIYWTSYTGSESKVEFSILDSGYGDNSGSLTVNIYKL